MFNHYAEVFFEPIPSNLEPENLVQKKVFGRGYKNTIFK
jgi:hypothetical protein